MKTRPGSRPGPRPPAHDWAPIVFLVGFMGAGKTSVGRALSRRLGWSFEDLDERVQAREGRSVTQIFSESGEGAFRLAENAALRELLSGLEGTPRVVALGGGAYVQPENAALLAEADAPTIFLDGTAEDLFRRCQEEAVERPLRRDLDEFRRLYEVRRPHYVRAALTVDTSGKDIEAVAAEVAAMLGFQ